MKSRDTAQARSFALRALLAAGAIGVMPLGASAQSFEVNRFRPAPLASDGFSVDGAQVPGHLKLSAGLYLDYASKPLALELANGAEYAVISEQLALHGTFALGLTDRLGVYVGVPFNVAMEGEDPPAGITTRVPPPEGAGLGDAYLGLRVRIAGDEDSPFMLGAQATLQVPTASSHDDQLYSGEESLAVEPQALAQLNVGILKVRANVGVRIRSEQDLPNVGNVTIGNELSYALGAELAVLDGRLRFLADAFGASFLEDFGGDAQTPLELLLGAKYQSSAGIYAGLGAGPGVSSGVGTPEWRLVATLGFASPVATDEDGDGLIEPDDRCPEIEEDRDNFEDTDGCPDFDNDRDDVSDAQDQCANVAEDADGVDDRDGCPDLDNDKDGVLDAQDTCASEPEDTDDFEDADGCPEADNDDDLMPDGEDSCTNEPEDKDGFEDGDGCPDPDNDKDGVPDAQDQCPTAPGAADAKGCPKAVRVEDGRIRILERIEFAVNSDEILPRSEALLGEVKSALEANPQIEKVRVEGHTDSAGKDKKNLELSKQRAASVARWLADHGIAGSRLTAFGCGEAVPMEDNATTEGRKANRRVEFHILTPEPKEGPRAIPGCEEQTF